MEILVKSTSRVDHTRPEQDLYTFVVTVRGPGMSGEFDITCPVGANDATDALQELHKYLTFVTNAMAARLKAGPL